MGSGAMPQVDRWDLYSSSLTILWQRKHSKVFISVRTFLFLICLGVFFTLRLQVDDVSVQC